MPSPAFFSPVSHDDGEQCPAMGWGCAHCEAAESAQSQPHACFVQGGLGAVPLCEVKRLLQMQ